MTKTCKLCNIDKPLTEFYKDKGTRDGYRSGCKPCKRKQNKVCAMCKKPPNGKRPLVVDHDHDTGEVRGLLCYGCNRAIAILDNLQLAIAILDNLELLSCAYLYLKKTA